MKERIGISIIFLIALFAFFPSLFAEGGFFSVKGFEEDLTGKLVFIDGVYFDNVYFLIIKFLVSYLGFVVPFILPKIGRLFSVISIMFGSWFFAAFLFEAWNFTIPSIVLNNNEDRELFAQYLFAFILGVTIIMIREIWQKSIK